MLTVIIMTKYETISQTFLSFMGCYQLGFQLT